MFRSLKNGERKCLETTDTEAITATVLLRGEEARYVCAKIERARRGGPCSRRQPMPAALSRRGHGAGSVVSITSSRVVACRGASTGTRGRVGEVARELSAVTELMTKIAKNPPRHSLMSSRTYVRDLPYIEISGRSLTSFRDDKHGEGKCERMRDTRSLVNAWRQRTANPSARHHPPGLSATWDESYIRSPPVDAP